MILPKISRFRGRPEPGQIHQPGDARGQRHTEDTPVADKEEHRVQHHIDHIGGDGGAQGGGGVTEGAQIAGENGDQGVADAESGNGLQVDLRRGFELLRDAHRLQNGVREADEDAGHDRAHGQIEDQSQAHGLPGHAGAVRADVLGHHRHHARGDDGEHDEEDADVGVGRTHSSHRLVALGGEHQGIHRAGEDGEEDLAEDGEEELVQFLSFAGHGIPPF